MEIKEILIKIKVDIKFPCILKYGEYRILKQENIVAEDDDLIAGIYFHQHFRYIICCHRKNNTLNYTRFADSEFRAQRLYKEMIQEIKRDLER